MVADLRELAPAVLLTLACALVLAGDLDTRCADILYAWQGHAWSLRHDFVVSKIFHARAQKASIVIEVAMLLAATASYLVPRLRPWRRGLTYVSLTALAGLGAVALAKFALPIACPSQLQRYGGLLPDRMWLGRELVPWGKGCFPAAHASGGFALCGWYFLARHHGLAGAWRYGAVALVSGAVLGLAQQVRGAHFLSHDLAAAAVCWALAWLLARTLLNPANVPTPCAGSFVRTAQAGVPRSPS